MLPIRDHEPSRVVPFVTISLILVNALVFFLELSSSNIELLIGKWALIPATVNFGNLASLLPFITSQFLHGGIAHILFNMWYLWIFGDNVEGHFGHVAFLFFYLAAGIFAAFAQCMVSANSAIPILGASGAIAGVLGAYALLFPRHRVDTLVPTFLGFWSRTTLPASFVLLFWFVTQLFTGIGSLGIAAAGGVAWWAHIGGFVFGGIFGWLTRNRLSHLHQPHAHGYTGDLWK